MSSSRWRREHTYRPDRTGARQPAPGCSRSDRGADDRGRRAPRGAGSQRRTSISPSPTSTPSPASSSRHGSDRAVVVPLLFTNAFHARIDVPATVAEAAASAPLELVTAGILGTGDDVADVAADRRQRCRDRRRPSGRLLYAVGSSDPAANTAVHELAERLAAGAARPYGPRSARPSPARSACWTSSPAPGAGRGSGSSRCSSHRACCSIRSLTWLGTAAGRWRYRSVDVSRRSSPPDTQTLSDQGRGAH